jgi:hypothetical protein
MVDAHCEVAVYQQHTSHIGCLRARRSRGIGCVWSKGLTLCAPHRPEAEYLIMVSFRVPLRFRFRSTWLPYSQSLAVLHASSIQSTADERKTWAHGTRSWSWLNTLTFQRANKRPECLRSVGIPGTNYSNIYC